LAAGVDGIGDNFTVVLVMAFTLASKAAKLVAFTKLEQRARSERGSGVLAVPVSGELAEPLLATAVVVAAAPNGSIAAGGAGGAAPVAKIVDPTERV
jgi:hypothetical protein